MKSIRYKFLGFISVLLIILLLLLDAYPIISSRNAVFEEKKTSLSSQAVLVSAALARLDHLEARGIRDVLNLLEITGYNTIAVTDASGTIIYNTAGSALTDTVMEDIMLALEGKTVFRSSFKDSAFTSSCANPLMFKGATLGAVCLFESDTERAEILLSIQRLIRIISVVVSIAALLFTIFFSKMLLSRIEDLVLSMRTVATGDYSHRLVPRGQDEVAELGNEFNLLTERLEDNEQQMRRFVSDASHELKTPLASIRLLADSIVQNDMDSETMREFVTDIGHEAERLSHTTEKLLDLSRMDDKLRIIPTPVDIKQVVVDALVMLMPLAEEKEVHIKCDLDDGCVVMATVDDIFHIVFNIMDNAVKYNVPEGTVTVRLSGDEDNVRFSVEDTGIGIPEEDRLNIFSRFYRVDKARSREAGGSGLGLSIAHDCCAVHGASISVGPNDPHGSIFEVSFPRPNPEETGI